MVQLNFTAIATTDRSDGLWHTKSSWGNAAHLSTDIPSSGNNEIVLLSTTIPWRNLLPSVANTKQTIREMIGYQVTTLTPAIYPPYLCCQ